jgi:predicted nuclease of predicted toxin-antitoxin system
MPDWEGTLLLDQNIPRTLRGWLQRRTGWRVIHIKDAKLWHRPDFEILRRATAIPAILVTFDADFGNLRRFPPGSHGGILWLDVHPTTEREAAAAINRLLDRAPLNSLRGASVRVTRSDVEIHHPRPPC